MKQNFCFHTEFEISTRHPSGDVNKAVSYMSKEIRGEVWVG